MVLSEERRRREMYRNGGKGERPDQRAREKDEQLIGKTSGERTAEKGWRLHSISWLWRKKMG